MKSFRKEVMTRAHEIAKRTGECIAIALMRSWKVYRLKKNMLTAKVKFAYKTVSGRIRYATGTLNNLSYTTTGNRKINYGVLCYFDIEADGFRSFRAENLVRIY